MRFKRNNVLVEIEHEHDLTVFNVRAYSQTKYSSNSGVFDEINQYLSTLPEDRQRCIYEIYKTVAGYLQTVREVDAGVIEYLALRVKELYNYLNLRQLDSWLRMAGVVGIPPTSTDKLSDDLEENRTYLAEDYRNLITLTVASRMMLPIWGDLQSMIPTTGRGSSRIKEVLCLKIVTQSGLWTLPAISRLEVYIEATINAKGGSISALVAGFGSDRLPEMLMAGAIIKRLVVAPLNVDLERGGLAKNVHGYCQSAIKDFDIPGSKAKVTADAMGDSETGEDFSSLEKLRLRDKESVGTVEKYKAWLMLAGPVGLARAIDPTINPSLIQECVETNSQLEYINLQQGQLILAKWMIFLIMPTLSIDLFTRMEISKIVMPAFQALLIHWNFLEVAVLITAEKITDLQLISPVTYQRISKSTMTILAEMFPYQITSKASVNERQSNVGYQSIEHIAGMFSGCNWNLTVPPTVVSQIPGMRPLVSAYPTPADISEKFALLIIKIWSLNNVTRFNAAVV